MYKRQSLSQALLTHPELIAPHLDRLPGLEQHPFAALNTAFWEDGAFIYLPPGAVVETPIHLIFHASGGDMAVYPRLLLMLAENAQATVIVEYQGVGRYLNAPVTEARLSDGAVLHYHNIQQESPQAQHFGGIRLQQGRNSGANLHLLSFGAQVALSLIHILESHDQMDTRLIKLLKMPEGDMFKNREEYIEDAYRVQGERIAHEDARMIETEEVSAR